MTLGIRPEKLRPAAPAEGTVAGEVVVAERLGGQTLLHVQLAADLLVTVQTDGEDDTRIHDRLHLVVPEEACHLFGVDGRALPRRGRHPLADLGRDARRAPQPAQ